MGWNDHVEFTEMTCDECGETDTWELWNDVALFRYSKTGPLAFLGHDDSNANKCPHCGSDKGTPVDTDEEDRQAYWDNLLGKDD